MHRPSLNERSTQMKKMTAEEHLPSLVDIIQFPPSVSEDAANDTKWSRDSCLAVLCDAMPSASHLLAEADALDAFRRSCPNLYERVRALFFLYAIHRFHLPSKLAAESQKEGSTTAANSCSNNLICPRGYEALLDRRFEEAIDHFLVACAADAADANVATNCSADEKDEEADVAKYKKANSVPSLSSLATDSSTSTDSSTCACAAIPSLGDHPPSDALSSALAKSYHSLALQTLADQVRSSVQSHDGNGWLFAFGLDQETQKMINHPYRITLPHDATLRERTPVRMDLSHAGWSDIFFLGMDYPEGARVINCSVDLSVHGRMVPGAEGELIQEEPIPPVEAYVRVIEEPVLRLVSVDLKTKAELTTVGECFDFAADYVGLLKAGIVAAGIVPPSLEEWPDMKLADLFRSLINDDEGRAKGLELVTKVNDIPKGSRLAVSTNLLGCIISVCMRATGQTASLTGPLLEEERRLVAARAILGEWLGGSGGGWQDSGGVWPGLKLITGVEAEPGDPEYNISCGRLLPVHRLLGEAEAPTKLRDALRDSLVLVHGGMAQNVGPILEMVTEKYLLRSEKAWKARQKAISIQNAILSAFRDDNIQRAVQTVAKLTTENFFGPIIDIIPWATNSYTETVIDRVKRHFKDRFWGFWMLGGMSGGGMGFIFDPVAKSEALDVLGAIMTKTKREMEGALPFAMDPVVYDFEVNNEGSTADWYSGASAIPAGLSADTDEESNGTKTSGNFREDAAQDEKRAKMQSLDDLLNEIGFDSEAHEAIRSDLRSGAIGLAQNRLSVKCELSDAAPEDVVITEDVIDDEIVQNGIAAIRKGTVGVVTLAAGVGSRWTQGAGCVKAIHPFCQLGGKHRTFLEVHLAKSRRISHEFGGDAEVIPHVFTTSHMTEAPIKEYLQRNDNHGYDNVITSHGQTIGVRMIPMVRDLKFAWEEQNSQRLDDQAQKVKESLEKALIGWAESCGEGADYRDNLPMQCLCPVGHYFEIPNLLLNGTLSTMLDERPQLKTLLLHNIDTVGADVDPGLLGLFLQSDSILAYEVVPRRVEDTGGGLGRVDGKPRLLEGLALPAQDDELKFSYYNSLTTWIDIDSLLSKYGLRRTDLNDTKKVEEAVHVFSRRLPTYVTLKNVKRRWGNGQEDIHPVAQFEKLWGDMASLEDIECDFFVVPRSRGQQLKDPAQLDGWSRDGSSCHLESLCRWE